MLPIPADIFTEPEDVSPDGLANLGPLCRLAGVWRADKGIDINPKADGPERRTFIEHIRMDPIDPQANGPQLFYGLRYHIHINTPEEDITFHDQVGYWLWEPATGLVMQTLAIPRGQVLLASGKAKPDDKTISVTAKRGDTAYGICSTEFLEQAFRTDAYRCDITFNEEGGWTYLIQTELFVRGAPFNHRDTNTLQRVAPPKLNPLAAIVTTAPAAVDRRPEAYPETSMKPYVICLMHSSLDGRTHPSRWRPKGSGTDWFEKIHDELGGDAWVIGRVTGSEFAKGKPYPATTDATFPREHWFSRRDAKTYGVVLDAHGKIGWGRSDIGGDPIVVVLTESVPDSHLAGLRGEGVSYIFAGKSEIDLALALDILNRELGVKRLLVEGGGVANGAFLRAGLIDEFNLILSPAIDGASGAPFVFDSAEADSDKRAPLAAMALDSTRDLGGGVLLLRYRITNDPQAASR